MKNMGVSVLPDIVNALLITSIFSAGNTYTYCAIRRLYSLALEGQAHAFLKKCNRHGVPIYCWAVVMFIQLLSLLQLPNNSSMVLQWLVNLVAAGCVLDYVVICIIFTFFYRACAAQGINRKTFPYYGCFQPYTAYVGLAGTIFIVLGYGYSTFALWDVGTFFNYYTMVLVGIVSYSSWTTLKRTKFVSPLEADLVWERPQIDAYEAGLAEESATGFWREISQMFGLSKPWVKKVEV